MSKKEKESLSKNELHSIIRLKSNENKRLTESNGAFITQIKEQNRVIEELKATIEAKEKSIKQLYKTSKYYRKLSKKLKKQYKHKPEIIINKEK